MSEERQIKFIFITTGGGHLEKHVTIIIEFNIEPFNAMRILF